MKYEVVKLADELSVTKTGKLSGQKDLGKYVADLTSWFWDTFENAGSNFYKKIA